VGSVDAGEGSRGTGTFGEDRTEQLGREAAAGRETQGRKGRGEVSRNQEVVDGLVAAY
jgi:hypothetical protein